MSSFVRSRSPVLPAVLCDRSRTSTPEVGVTESRSLRIAAELRAQIESGELAPGERVPSAREITRRWGVAVATASRALAALRDDGLVRPVPGVGTVVVSRSPPRTSRPRRRVEQVLSLDRIVAAAVVIAD